jgi:hypothetical protein
MISHLNLQVLQEQELFVVELYFKQNKKTAKIFAVFLFPNLNLKIVSIES